MTTFLRGASIAPRTIIPTQSILRLPPNIRTTIFRQQSRQFSLADGVVAIPHLLLTTLHATGLPWAAVIPISAIAVRVLITFTITLPARNATTKQMQIVPLQSAYRRAAHNETLKKFAHMGPAEIKGIEAVLRKECDEFDRKLERAWISPGRRFWQFYPILQLPVFLSVMEAVRSMIGMRQGLIGAAITSFRESTPSMAEATEATAMSSPIVGAAAGDQVIDIPTIAQVVTPELSATALPPSPTEIPPLFRPEWYEPTMTTEGLPWMLDLTSADPTPFPLTMSFIVSGFMLGNLFLTGPRKVPGMVVTPFRRGLNRALILFTLCIAPLTLHLPAGLVYYWACSSASGLAASLWLDRTYPLKGSVKACKRPLRRD